MCRPWTCCREVGWIHRDGYWKLSCGKWGLVWSLILKTGPGVLASRPLIKERSKRLPFLFHSLSRGKFATEIWMMGIIILQNRVVTRLWCWKWCYSGWHQRPRVVKWWVHMETSVASGGIREETMFSHLSFKSLDIPVIVFQLNKILPYRLPFFLMKTTMISRHYSTRMEKRYKWKVFIKFLKRSIIILSNVDQ